MQTKQAIQTSANVVRITSIKPGDVYKRFEENYDDKTFFGLVKNVHNDGEKCIVEATEFIYRYSTLDVQHKVLMGEKDYILFPSSPDELDLTLEEAKKSELRKIEKAEGEIIKSKKIIIDIDGLISGETQKSLQAMSYRELTQQEYNDKKLALN